MYLEVIFGPANMSEEKLPVCGCAQSHMYKVAYVCRVNTRIVLYPAC